MSATDDEVVDLLLRDLHRCGMCSRPAKEGIAFCERCEGIRERYEAFCIDTAARLLEAAKRCSKEGAELKVWQKETWMAGGAYHVEKVVDRAAPVATIFDALLEDDFTSARTKLAAAAPDLVRALLAVEWVGQEWDCGALPDACPRCKAYREDGHTFDCTLDAALRKAGIR